MGGLGLPRHDERHRFGETAGQADEPVDLTGGDVDAPFRQYAHGAVSVPELNLNGGED